MKMIKVKILKNILIKPNTKLSDKEIYVSESEYHLFKKLGYIEDLEIENINDVKDIEIKEQNKKEVKKNIRKNKTKVKKR